MKIVGIHGIAHNYLSAAQIEHAWFPALQGGLENAGYPRIERTAFSAVFYGDLFRQPGMRSANIPKLSAQNIVEEWEKELLFKWWQEAAQLSSLNRSNIDLLGEDPTIQSPDFQGRGRTPELVQRALKQLAKSRFFQQMGSSEKVWIFALKQVYLYLHDLEMKQSILQRVSEKVSTDTQVIIAHSLGSVVAYEALCAHPEWNVHTLVTCGSPLGIPNLVFDRLVPSPENRVGMWPNVREWFNISDRGDIVALQKDIAPYFTNQDGATIIDLLVYNGWESHSAENYLTAKETGAAIVTGLFK
jgi:hypothetical protein